jgi:hypothetical protein
LTSLNLSFNHLFDAGLRALADSPHLAGLTTLSLRRNQIGPEGGLALADSPHLGRLTRLDLTDNPLDRQTRQALRARFGSRVRLTDSRAGPRF